MAIAEKFLARAKVLHKRLIPRVNQFCYDVFYIGFDITKINSLKSKIFSINKFNIFSFYSKDYGAKDGSDLEKWIREILATENLNQKTQRIFLLTHPRILGYAFNPVSFWFCLNADERLIAVLAQVNNTFGETHSYLIFNQDFSEISGNQWLTAKKEFHVSPFMEVKGKYQFRFIFSGEKIAAWIDYFTEEKTLLTSLITKNETLSNLALIKAFAAIPFVTFKVIFLIHYQALKLLLKGNKYISKPQQLQKKITLSEKS